MLQFNKKDLQFFTLFIFFNKDFFYKKVGSNRGLEVVEQNKMFS